MSTTSRPRTPRPRYRYEYLTMGSTTVHLDAGWYDAAELQKELAQIQERYKKALDRSMKPA